MRWNRAAAVVPVLVAVFASSCGGETKTECPQGSPDTCGIGAAQVCTDLRTDDGNCGACGVACAAGKSCVASACVASCTWTSHTVSGIDTASVNYAGGGQWIDNNTRAYVSPPDYDITGWVKFDLSSVPADALVARAEMRLSATTVFSSPQVAIRHSTASSWSRATATAASVPRGPAVAGPRGVSVGWNSFDLDVNGHDFGADLAARFVTLGVTNTNTTYSYAYFEGSDLASTRPTLELLTCE